MAHVLFAFFLLLSLQCSLYVSSLYLSAILQEELKKTVTCSISHVFRIKPYTISQRKLIRQHVLANSSLHQAFAKKFSKYLQVQIGIKSHRLQNGNKNNKNYSKCLHKVYRNLQQ